MAYCTVKDILDMLKDDMLNNIIGDDYIEDVPDRIEAITPLAEQAAADAAAEIDGYLAKRYDVPFKKPPAVVVKFAKDIALYNLVSRKGIDEGDREKTYLTRYNAAVAFLTKAAKGEIDLGIPDGVSPAASAQASFAMGSQQRIFDRESMKGW